MSSKGQREVATSPSRSWATVLFTSIALVAFAANSILCRQALAPKAIDAASFTTLRVAAGALTLVLIHRVRAGRLPGLRRPRSNGSPLALFLYAACFSFAYVSLPAGTGALILFGAVQITMMVAALMSKERPTKLQWLGYATALAGMVHLVAPGVEAPSLSGALLMALAGFGWGLYSLLGRGSGAPLADSARNFTLATPLTLLTSLVCWSRAGLTFDGILLAVISGSLTSGLGYVVWYRALLGLTAARAAVVQLAVPIIAAAGGVAFLGEVITARLTLSAVLILGGIALAVRR